MTRGRAPPSLRAIATDIDGTITDVHRRIYAPALAWLRRLEHRKVPIFLATGNVLPIALAYHRLLGLTAPIVAEGGGLICEPARGRVTRLADREIALRALRKLRRAGISATPLFTDRWRETEVALEPQLDVGAARRALRGYPVDVIPTGYAVHLIERGCGKLPALTRVLKGYGLTPADCLIAGDGENDVEMLRAAGWAVSFRGADRLARAAADYVASSGNARGLVEALKRAHVLGSSVLR